MTIINRTEEIANTLALVNTTALSDFMAFGITTLIVLLAVLTGTMFVGWLKIALQNFSCEEEAIECLSLEDMSAQEWVDSTDADTLSVEVLHMGAIVVDTVKASYQRTQVMEDVCMDSGESNPALDNVVFPHNLSESKAFQWIGLAKTRAVQNGMLAMVAMALAFVLPAASFVDDVVAMPTTVRELKVQNAELKNEIQKLNTPAPKAQPVEIQVSFMHKDPTDAPMPMNLR